MPSRWCSTETTFARSSATSCSSLISSPGRSANARADDEEAARLRQPVPHHLDQQRRVDVAAGEDHAGLVVPGHLAREQGGDRRGARALDEQLRALEQEHDRVADLLVGDGDDVVEQLVEDRGRQLPGCLTAMPSAIV